jgi:hypothetical protein
MNLVKTIMGKRHGCAILERNCCHPENRSARDKANMKRLTSILLLAMVIAACGGGTSMPSVTSTPKPPEPPPGMPTMWTTMQSPVFPSEWPPTASTTWVRYTFAYGNNPAKLMDGAYVTQPLTRTLVQRDGTAGESMTLSTVLEEAGIQGVRPLDAASSAALGKGAQAQTQLLALQAAPDETVTAEVRGYYRVWVNLNGAFAKFIRPNHAAFFDWIEAGQ